MTETRKLQFIVAALIAGAAVIASLPSHAGLIAPSIIKQAIGGKP